MHPFRQYISTFTTVPDNEWEEIANRITRGTFSKGEIILRNGEVCKKLYFLEEGLLRFFVLKEGVEVSKFFTIAPYCFTSQKSFSDQIPSKDNIEVLEGAVIWEMSKSDAFDLFRLKSWNEFVRKLIQEVQYNTEQILEDAQHVTAESRYIKMIEENNQLLRRVSLKHIATYLGIAPQSLSRIRKKYVTSSRKLT